MYSHRTHPDHVHLVCRVVEGPVQRPIVTDGGYHDDVVCRQLPHLVHEGLVHEVRAPDAKVEDVDLLHDGKVEGVQELACVGDLVVGEHPVDVELGVRGEAQALLR